MREWRADIALAAVALAFAAFVTWLSAPHVAPAVLSIAAMGAVRRVPRVVLAIQALVAVVGGDKPVGTVVSIALTLVTLAVVALRYGSAPPHRTRAAAAGPASSTITSTQ